MAALPVSRGDWVAPTHLERRRHAQRIDGDPQPDSRCWRRSPSCDACNASLSRNGEGRWIKSGGRERSFDDDQICHDTALDQVFLDDAFERWWITAPIPRTLRVHDGDRSALTDTQTIRFRAQHASTSGQSQLLEASLQIIPGSQPTIPVAALGVRLIAAQKDMDASRSRRRSSRQRDVGSRDCPVRPAALASEAA